MEGNEEHLRGKKMVSRRWLMMDHSRSARLFELHDGMNF